MKRIISLLLVFIMVLTLAFTLGSCQKSTDPITVIMEVNGFGTMKLELYPDVAPITVENFVNYVNDGFYDGLTFHRIYKGFMIQGGDPDGTGSGGQNLTQIKGEFAANGVENDLSHTRGTISMARATPMDSATSQFFICDADSTFLDGQYAAFGKLVDGYDVLDAIADVEVKANPYNGEMSVPLVPVVIDKVYVEK